jgi:predicted amidohydrolase YtcJ
MDFPLEPTILRDRAEALAALLSMAYNEKQQGSRGFASAWPVARIDVLAGIGAMITRRPWITGLAERSLSVTDAVTDYIAEGAYAEFAKNKKGGLKDG